MTVNLFCITPRKPDLDAARSQPSKGCICAVAAVPVHAPEQRHAQTAVTRRSLETSLHDSTTSFFQEACPCTLT